YRLTARAAGLSVQSNAFTVAAGVVESFDVTSSTTTPNVGIPFSVTFTAKDHWQNPTANVPPNIRLTATANGTSWGISPATFSFGSGQTTATQNITLQNAGINVTLTATAANNATGSITFGAVVVAPVHLTTPSLMPATVGVAYPQTMITASGGTGS